MSADRKKIVAEKIAGAMIAFTILTKGWAEAAHFAHHPLRVGFIFAAGLFVLASSLLYERIERRIHHFAALFHVLEGLVEILCATLLLANGGHWIPYFLYFIGVFYVVMGTVQFLTRNADPEATMVRCQPYFGGAFLAFAAVVSTINLLTERKLPVFVVAGIMVIAGLLLIFRRRAMPRLYLVRKLLDRSAATKEGE